MKISKQNKTLRLKSLINKNFLEILDYLNLTDRFIYNSCLYSKIINKTNEDHFKSMAKNKSFNLFINEAFCWEDTIEGNDFWSKLFDIHVNMSIEHLDNIHKYLKEIYDYENK